MGFAFPYPDGDIKERFFTDHPFVFGLICCVVALPPVGLALDASANARPAGIGPAPGTPMQMGILMALLVRILTIPRLSTSLYLVLAPVPRWTRLVVPFAPAIPKQQVVISLGVVNRIPSPLVVIFSTDELELLTRCIVI